MTFSDLFGVKNQDVDPIHVANAIGSLLQSLGSGDTTASAPGPLSGTYDSLSNAGASATTPVTPTQPAQSTPTTDTTTTSSSDTADPVPQGTAIAQGWGHNAPGGHPGVDLSVPVGTTIVSAISGTVTHAAGDDPGGYGNWVEVTGPNGIATRYGHLSYIGTKAGDKVKAGQPIGKSGGAAGAPGAGNSTGPHLHFEVDQNGQTLDPIPYLAGGAQILAAPESSDASATASAPPRPVSGQDAADTGVARLMGSLTGNDPGSENARTPEAPKDTTSMAKGTGATVDSDPNAIDTFLMATRAHESGGGVMGQANYTIRNTSGQSNAAGAYQFIGTTWRGMGGSTESAADASPAEQDAIARKMATQLFNQFHSWRLVAIAWYGGPAVAEQVAQGINPGSPQGQGPYMAYGDTIQQMMSGK